MDLLKELQKRKKRKKIYISQDDTKIQTLKFKQFNYNINLINIYPILNNFFIAKNFINFIVLRKDKYF